ncbi:hypothetical protein, partial [Streptomyces noursei]|uniref:hypothetical protein n=1 Tax=Streptomyces noursei TaxID=1971 RepID=UPI003F4CEDF1
IRQLMHTAAEDLDTDTDRLSFTRTLRLARRQWTTTWRPSTGTSVIRPWYPCTFTVGVPHPGCGGATSGVRDVITTALPPSATSSTTSADSPENTVPIRELTSNTRS